jgi:hypothetical protein
LSWIQHLISHLSADSCKSDHPDYTSYPTPYPD